MTAVFERILEMSLTSAVVIMVVMAIRLLLRKAPRKYSYALWSVAAFRLVCPVSFRSMFSLFRLTGRLKDMDAHQTVAHVLSYTNDYDIGVPLIPSEMPTVTETLPPVTVTTAPTPEVTIPGMVQVPGPGETVGLVERIVDLAAIVWLAGLAALAIYGIVSYVRLRRRMSTAVLANENVWQSDRVQSPFILGFMRPKIYLPFGLSADQQRYVLAHERYHIRRLDHIVRPLSFLILAVHWFNPLVWVAYYMMSRDMEMSCDEKVLSTEDNIRREYSITLLSFAANRRFPSPSPLAFGESGVKGRIKNALNWKKPRTWVTIIAILVCIVVIIVCAANPASHPYDWTKNLTMEDVDWMELMVNGEERSSRRLQDYEARDLVELLNDLKRSEMKQPRPLGTWAFPTERMVTICCDGIEYKLNLGPSPMTLNSKDEAVAWGNDDPWFVSNEELKQFIRDLPEGDSPVELSDGYYHSVECLFMSSYSSVAATSDSGSLYLLESAGEELRLISKGNGDFYPLAADGGWQELSEEFLHKMEEGTITIGGTDLWDTLRKERPRIRLYGADYLFLLDFGDELWVGIYGYDRNDNISLSSMYRLEPVSVIDADSLGMPEENQLLFSALQDKVEIVDTGLGMTDVLSKLVEAAGSEVEMEITKISTIDLDGDGIREVLLQIETPGTVYGTKILRYNDGDGQIYAYDLWYRAFMYVKTDGTFAYSGGAADSGFGRISFTADGYEVEKITYSESSGSGNVVNFYVNKQPAAEEAFYSVFEEWQKIPKLTWADYTPFNALRLLLATGEIQVVQPATCYLSADLTHDGVDELVTIRQETDEIPIIHSLTVSDSNGKELWRGEVTDMRGGHNGFYLYERDGKHYILQWLPDEQQGWYSYSYQVFSFDLNGAVTVLEENAMQYDVINQEQILEVDVEAIRAFEAEVNALLKDAAPLLVIHNDKNLIGKFSGTDQWKSPADDWASRQERILNREKLREDMTLAVWPLNDLTLTVLSADSLEGTGPISSCTIDVYGANDYFFWSTSFDRMAETLLYFRYEENGVQYLMEFKGTGRQGIGIWDYRIFSVLPESLVVIRENSLYYEAMSAETTLTVNVDEIRAFEAEVNALLEHAEYIAGFDGNGFSYNTPGNGPFVYDISTGEADRIEQRQQELMAEMPLVYCTVATGHTQLRDCAIEQTRLRMGDYEIAYIRSIEEISTGAVGIDSGMYIYRVTYQPMDYDKDAVEVTQRGSEHFYLVTYEVWPNSMTGSEENAWYFVDTLSEEALQSRFNTPGMLERYNDPYLAAVVETVRQWKNSQ